MRAFTVTQTTCEQFFPNSVVIVSSYAASTGNNLTEKNKRLMYCYILSLLSYPKAAEIVQGYLYEIIALDKS